MDPEHSLLQETGSLSLSDDRLDAVDSASEKTESCEDAEEGNDDGYEDG